LSRFPDAPDLLLELSEIKWDLGRFEEAAAVNERLLALQPSSASGHVDRAAILYRNGAFVSSRAEAERGLELEPDAEHASQAHLLLADISAKGSDFEGAVAHCSKALAYEGAQQDPTVHARYAIWLRQDKRPDDADGEAELALSSKQVDTETRDALRSWGLPRGAIIASQSGGWQGLRYFVRGVVTNQGKRGLPPVRVVAELWDANSVLVGTGQAYTESDHLSSGESAAFQIEIRGFTPPQSATEASPDLERILGRRPEVSTVVVGRPGSVLYIITSAKRQGEIDAQNEWESKKARLVEQWKARPALPEAPMGYRFRVHVAVD
jgi:tetratricopeptide (TPR) repeat protein